MKRLAIVLAATITLASCHKKMTLPTDAENMCLIGKVKSMTEVTEYNSLYGKRIDTTVYKFDEKGYFTEAERHLWNVSEADTVGERITRAFNYDTPNVVEMIARNDKGEQLQKMIKKLDNNGLPTEMSLEKKDANTYRVTYNYKGTDAESFVKIDGDTIGVRVTAKYNDKGQVLLEEMFQPQKEFLIEKKTYTYNDKGFMASLVTERMLGMQQKKVTTYQYEYDEKGSATEVKEYEDDELVSTAKRTIEYY